MATTPAMLTIEQYLQTSYSPDVDFVDGELQQRNVGERDHGQIQGYVYTWFMQREASFSLEPALEQRMLVTSDRVRICDIAVIREDIPEEQVPTIPPSSVLKLCRPKIAYPRAIQVLEDYRAMGVPHIWLIDPQERLAYTFSDGGLRQQQDLILRANNGIAMDVNEMFIKLDRKKNKESA